jgi:predicted DNA-binding antitoxin AbrB/MazE fold protein
MDENGVFHPLEPVDPPDGFRVELHSSRLVGDELNQNPDAIYKVLGRRHTTGEHDLAARHIEHQP